MASTRIYHRAPRGGIEVAGKFYAGGQFIPAPKAPEGRWIIRPRTVGTARDFRPVAIVSGREIVSGPKIGRLASLADARAWIAAHYANGTAFPAPPDRTAWGLPTDADRARYRTV